MPFAYWSGSIRDAMAARDSATFARLAPAGPWQFREWSHEGRSGVIAEWAGTAGAVDELYGKPRACADGLVYFPSKAPLRQEDLAKRNAPNGLDYTTTTGVTLTVPLAAAAPRFVGFEDNAPALGDPFGDFATVAQDVFDRLTAGSILYSDPTLRRLVLLAIGQCYRVTAESLGELRWITTADVEPILLCVMGTDPKALPDAGGPSPSPAPGSPTSP
jgi:hypothetical protein